MQYKILIIATLSLAATSCGSHGGDAPAPTQRAIAFNPGGSSSRAESSALESLYDSFAVKTWKNASMSQGDIVMGSETDLNASYRVNYLAGWYYDGIGTQTLKYWDLAATRYDFAAVAPYATSSQVNFTADGYPNVLNVTGNVASTTDWAVARHARVPSGSSYADYDLITSESTAYATLAAMYADVPLVFHRILSSIEFRIYSSEGEAFTVTDFAVTAPDGISTGATYSPTSTTWLSAEAWVPTSTTATEIIPSQTGFTIDTSGAVSRETSAMLGSRVEIPQSPAGKIQLLVTLTIDGEDVDVNITVNDGWQPNKKYIYYLIYNRASADPILVDIDVTALDWSPGDSIDITQTDW